MNSPLNSTHSLGVNTPTPNDSENSSAVLRFQGQCAALQTNRKGRLKSVNLQLTDTVITLDIPKVLGYSLQNKVQIGDSVQAWVRPQKKGFKTLMLLPDQESLPAIVTSWAAAVPIIKRINDRCAAAEKSTPVKLQVCTKGSCRKRGSVQLLEGLRAQIQEQGYQDQVQLEPVGCLKLCKKAPNVCLFPSGERVSATDLKDIKALLPSLG